MATRTKPYTPWYRADYERAGAPARMVFDGFERRHLVRLFQGIPAMEATPSGTRFAAWYAGGQTEGPDNFVLVARARQGGPWEIPYCIVECQEGVRAFDPSLWMDPQGRLHLFWAQAHLFFDGREGVWEAVCAHPDADHPVWTSPRRLCDGLMLNKPTALSDGRWLYTVARAGLRRFHPMPAATVIGLEDRAESRAQVWRSSDEGQSLSFVGEVKDARTDFGEHMVYERRDGSLVMLLRAAPALLRSVSSDGGSTWSGVEPCAIPSPCSRFFIRRLASGRLLLVNHATAEARNRLSASVSEDDGLTWRSHLMLDARDLVSYPDGNQTPDGRIHIIYDRDRYGVMEILCACVTEDDILAGRLLDDHSYVQRVIDRP